MTAFDYAVIALMAASIFLGLWRGVFGEIIALIAWVFAFFAAKWWGAMAAHVFFSRIDDPLIRQVVGWLSVFLIVLVLMALVRLAVSSLVRALGLGISDRFLGMIFGTARGLLVLLFVVAIVGMTSMPKEKWWQEAYFAMPLETAVLACKPWLPPDIAKRIQFK